MRSGSAAEVVVGVLAVVDQPLPNLDEDCRVIVVHRATSGGFASRTGGQDERVSWLAPDG
jgi:hypothetical protein